MDSEAYLIKKAKEWLKNDDLFMAKSCLLTASCLFPKSSKIQFQRFNMAKNENNILEASKYFVEMFFTHQQVSDKEVEEAKNLVYAIKNCETNTAGLFYRQLFNSLSTDHQHKLLVYVADLSEDTVELCTMMLLILRRFPEKINEHSLRLVELLNSAEQNWQPNAKCSPSYLRKLLVFEVIPLILSPQSSFKLSAPKAQDLLIKAMRFYVDESVISDFSETNATNSIITDIEKKMKEILLLSGEKLNWEIITSSLYAHEADELENSLERDIQKLIIIYDKLLVLGINEDANAPIDLSLSNSNANSSMVIDSNSLQQLFLSSLILLLRCLNNYFQKTMGKYVLIEQSLTGISIDKQLKKKRKLVTSEPFFIIGDDNLKESFILCVKVYDLFNRDYNLQKELSAIIGSIGLNNSKAYENFVTDFHIYKGNYREAIALLDKKANEDVTACVQIVSCFVMVYEYITALEYSIIGVTMLKDSIFTRNDESNCRNIQKDSKNRVLKFLFNSPSNLLSYFIEVILSCLKDKVILSLKPSDAGLCHLIVLSQYNWPKEIDLFVNCMALVKKILTSSTPHSSSAPKFAYPQFFEYVFNPDILEEFMSLINEGFNLELKPSSASCNLITKSPAKSITTRGVNKNAKEEMKSALVSQMKSCTTQLNESIFIDFILKEIKNFFV